MVKIYNIRVFLVSANLRFYVHDGFDAIGVVISLKLCRWSVKKNETRRQKKRSSGFPTRSDTNRAVQSQKMARDLKFRI